MTYEGALSSTVPYYHPRRHFLHNVPTMAHGGVSSTVPLPIPSMQTILLFTPVRTCGGLAARPKIKSPPITTATTRPALLDLNRNLT